MWFVWVLTLAGLLWLARQATSGVWRLRFAGGRLEKAQGKIASPVAAALRRVAAESRVSGVVSLHGQDELRFSSTVSEEDRQRFRNVYFSVK